MFLKKGNWKFGAFWKLARLSSNGTMAVDLTDLEPAGSTRVSPLERLPTELLNQIFDSTELPPEDLVALGVCSKTLWLQVLAHVRQDYRKAAAPWAQKPLLCSGTWLTDLPPAIYEQFPDEQVYERQYRNRNGRWYGPCPARKWNWAGVGGYADVEGKDCRKTWLAALNALSWSKEVVPTVMDTLRSSLEAVLYRDSCVAQRNWVLRNVTDHQYVRLKLDRPRLGEATHVHVRGAPRLSLDQALILRACWGAADGYPRQQDEKNDTLLRGEWAGHRFEVVEDSVAIEAGWKDVTAEIIKEWKVWSEG